MKRRRLIATFLMVAALSFVSIPASQASFQYCGNAGHPQDLSTAAAFSVYHYTGITIAKNPPAVTYGWDIPLINSYPDQSWQMYLWVDAWSAVSFSRYAYSTDSDGNVNSSVSLPSTGGHTYGASINVPANGVVSIKVINTSNNYPVYVASAASN